MVETHRAHVPRWVAYLFAVLAIMLVPATVRVVFVAPPLLLAAHWRLAWGGFDVGLAVMLAATGISLRQRSTLAGLLAAATAALLACDAWMDILSSAGKSADSLLSAVAEAVVVELPLMGILIWVAASTTRRPTAEPPALPRRLAGTFITLGVALVPWIAWLFVTLPNSVIAHNWDITRASFIVALAALLATSAVSLFRHWRSARLLSAMTAALLMRDAWFNTLTARPSHTSLALTVALVLELPLAALCGWVAVRQAGDRRKTADRAPVLTAVPSQPDTTAGQNLPASRPSISDRPAC